MPKTFGKMFCRSITELAGTENKDETKPIIFYIIDDKSNAFSGDLYIAFRVYDELKNISKYTDSNQMYVELKIPTSVGLVTGVCAPNIITNDFNPDKQTSYPIGVDFDKEGVHIALKPIVPDAIKDKVVFYAFLRGKLL